MDSLHYLQHMNPVRERLARDMDSFFAKGGKIIHCAPGDRGQPVNRSMREVDASAMRERQRKAGE